MPMTAWLAFRFRRFVRLGDRSTELPTSTAARALEVGPVVLVEPPRFPPKANKAAHRSQQPLTSPAHIGLQGCTKQIPMVSAGLDRRHLCHGHPTGHAASRAVMPMSDQSEPNLVQSPRG